MTYEQTVYIFIPWKYIPISCLSYSKPMSCFLYVNDDDNVGKINIDDLYENRQKRDLKQVSIFNKILNRIHRRITLTARNKKNEQHVWFVIPEYIFGEPVYDKADCIAYIVSKLEVNKFHIRYVHPNTLFISWANWVPAYVRNEFKKKTGIAVDEQGQVVKKEDEQPHDEHDPMTRLLNARNGGSTNTSTKPQKEYTPIATYKPTGNLVYNPEMFEKLERKVSFA